MKDWFLYLQSQQGELLQQLWTHVGLTAFSVLIALLIGIPLGILAQRIRWLRRGILGLAGILQTIPSIALLGFMIPLLGIGVVPALVALFLYALLPIVRNTFTGIDEVPRDIRDAAKGMGMYSWQILTRVELPLALPVIFAGIRTATVINVGVATLAAYIGAGGLGEFIFSGISLNDSRRILLGAIPAALLALVLDALLGLLQKVPIRRLPWVLASVVLLGLVAAWANLRPQPLAEGGLMKAGFEPEFVGRSDGYPMLQETYGLSFDISTMNAALMYEAVVNGAVDVICAYATDGRIEAYDLVLLEDDKRAFPPYFAAPLVSGERLAADPALAETLNLLAGRLDDATMTALNFAVDEAHREISAVADSFLRAEGLWQAPRSGRKGTFVIGSKIFTEQYLLAEIYARLIEGHSGYRCEVIAGLGGTQICFEALRKGEIDMYPEYTGTGLQATLQPPDSVLHRLDQDPDRVYAYVKQAFEERYGLVWLAPLGFNNTYALGMRRAQAEQLGVKTITELAASLGQGR